MASHLTVINRRSRAILFPLLQVKTRIIKAVYRFMRLKAKRDGKAV